MLYVYNNNELLRKWCERDYIIGLNEKGRNPFFEDNRLLEMITGYFDNNK